jgi:hypothetical protein
VLSPVRHTEKPPPVQERFPVVVPGEPLPERKGRDKANESLLDASEDDFVSAEIERLPFPTLKEPVRGSGAALPGAVSFDSSLTQSTAAKDAPRTMIYSRSQDLHGTAIVAGKWGC